MKKMILVTLLALLAIAPAEAKKKKNTEGNALIAFVTESHDFGIISDDKGVVSTEFEFTNQGNAPLVITSAKADCGCTRPKGYLGGFTKNVKVKSNGSPKMKVLKITGVVNPNKTSKK